MEMLGCQKTGGGKEIGGSRTAVLGIFKYSKDKWGKKGPSEKGVLGNRMNRASQQKEGRREAKAQRGERTGYL